MSEYRYALINKDRVNRADLPDWFGVCFGVLYVGTIQSHKILCPFKSCIQHIIRLLGVNPVNGGWKYLVGFFFFFCVEFPSCLGALKKTFKTNYLSLSLFVFLFKCLS